MIKWSISVYSSNVDTVGWDDEGLLVVTWQSGKTSLYGPGVTEDLAKQIANSASVTLAINNDIKPNYGHRYA